MPQADYTMTYNLVIESLRQRNPLKDSRQLQESDIAKAVRDQKNSLAMQGDTLTPQQCDRLLAELLNVRTQAIKTLGSGQFDIKKWHWPTKDISEGRILNPSYIRN